MQIGHDQFGTGRYFRGYFDEARVSNTARSADWILTEYRNQSSPSTFLSAGAEGGGVSSVTGITSITGISSITF